MNEIKRGLNYAVVYAPQFSEETFHSRQSSQFTEVWSQSFVNEDSEVENLSSVNDSSLYSKTK